MNYKSHLEIAHSLWQTQFKPNASFIDATCGNGHDTLFIAQNALHLPNTHLTCIDIQEKALENTRKRLSSSLNSQAISKINYMHASHEQLPRPPSPLLLVVYNLGYLPGGDKSLTTTATSSLKSLQSALNLLAKGGLISLTLYPGHEEGRLECEVILPFLESLPANKFILTNPFRSTRELAPRLYIVEKI